MFSWSGAILFVHRYTAGSTSSGDKASKLHAKRGISVDTKLLNTSILKRKDTITKQMTRKKKAMYFKQPSEHVAKHHSGFYFAFFLFHQIKRTCQVQVGSRLSSLPASCRMIACEKQFPILNNQISDCLPT